MLVSPGALWTGVSEAALSEFKVGTSHTQGINRKRLNEKFLYLEYCANVENINLR